MSVWGRPRLRNQSRVQRLMHSLLFYVLLSLFSVSVNSFQYALPKDIYAYPKYRVVFLRNLSPIENKTALRWLSEGLQGGQREFLAIGHWQPTPTKEIESGYIQESTPDSQVPIVPDHQLNEHQRVSDESFSSPVLELLRLDQRSYLCLIPPPPSTSTEPTVEDQTPITPTHSWSLLQPLSGTCLYHRQAWFTYSYCHNVHVRQFRELTATHHHTTGARVVEEDPEWESYTLGRSPLANDATDEGNNAHDKLAIANNLELAHHQAAGQRYLVQRWADGTPCDKTGQPREVEIQFHCSMTMTDTIMFVKETQTCEYVLVIHTPRLCGEPGFKSHLEQVPEAEIQCREVLSDGESDSPSNEQEDKPLKFHPFRRIPRPPVVPAPPAGEHGGGNNKKSNSANSNKGINPQLNQLLQRVLGQLVGEGLNPGGDELDMENQDFHLIEVEDGEGDDGNIFLALNLEDDDDDDHDGGGGVPKSSADIEYLLKILRESGIELKQEDQSDDEDAVEEGDVLMGRQRAERVHNEL